MTETPHPHQGPGNTYDPWQPPAPEHQAGHPYRPDWTAQGDAPPRHPESSYSGGSGGSGGPAKLSLSRRSVAVLAGVALAAGLLGGGVGAAATYGLTDHSTGFVTASAGSQASEASSAPSGSVQQVANKVLPSVVSIGVLTPRGQATGSGFVLSSDGVILTNNHVVAPAAAGGAITVTFNDGSEAAAKIVGRDPATDIAVIKAQDVSGLQPAVLGHSSDLQVGQQVVAIGSPLGLSGTVTTGIVSAEHRPVRVGGSEAPGTDLSTVIDAVQTDAAINPGNSGGPLVNMNGEVIGVNTAIATPPGGGGSGSIGLGFAIPIDQARSIAKQLVETGSAAHARLGVRVTDVRSPREGIEGAGIVSVQPGTAAARGGLRSGDVVVKVEDRDIDSADALIAAVRSHRPGDTVRLTYVRDGSTKTTTVRLGSDAPAA